MNRKCIPAFYTVCVWCAAARVLLFPAGVAAETVNPHWTGKHCAECHEDGSQPALRFGGDIHRICVRCHDRKTAATFEPHPVQVSMPDAMRQRMSRQWPLQEGRISCRTCHDMLPQMYENIAVQIANPDFLRVGSQKQRDEFCFFCHDKKTLQKENPHKQLNPDGSINRNTCLVCHRADPDPENTAGSPDPLLISESPLLCGGCHAQQQQNHPARADHLVKPPAAMQPLLEKAGRDLPLVNGTIHCATCHNPHEPGVLKNRTAADARHFLRTGSPARLCITCHEGMDRASPAAGTFGRDILKTAPQPMVYHTPWAQNKCKACHAVSRELSEKPEALSLCLRQGCHDTKMLKKPFLHEPSVLVNCYFCHENHGSEYGRLLRTNQERICYTCHPLLRSPEQETAGALQEKKEAHAQFMAYMAGTGLEPGNECFYCHNPGHRARISTLATGSCADCHITVRNILQQAAAGPLTVHDRFTEKRCSECHDPHAGPYQYQLKKPVETYKNSG
jgi:predicted CXXCH cytochrome family protein